MTAKIGLDYVIAWRCLLPLDTAPESSVTKRGYAMFGSDEHGHLSAIIFPALISLTESSLHPFFTSRTNLKPASCQTSTLGQTAPCSSLRHGQTTSSLRRKPIRTVLDSRITKLGRIAPQARNANRSHSGSIEEVIKQELFSIPFVTRSTPIPAVLCKLQGHPDELL